MELAQKVCAERRVSLPEHPFYTDGCSMFPDSDWVGCCVVHDMAYWCGGTGQMRRAADRALQACVAETGRPTLGWWMEKAVRLGGIPWIPTPWRWGYGWTWPTGYTDEGSDEILLTE